VSHRLQLQAIPALAEVKPQIVRYNNADLFLCVHVETAALGFAMYKFVGCRTGACPLTGNPFIAMAVYGGLGALLAAGK
jgi:hypothetical protein